ncbi:serine/threonine protein kinase, partial [Planctomycetota bacterium]
DIIPLEKLSSMLAWLQRLGPDWFAGYKRTRQIADGGMARVYQGEDPAGGTEVVIKILKPSKIGRKKGSLWEGEISKRIKHPNLVETYACGTKRGNPFLVMEKLDDPCLKERTKKQDASLKGRRLEILKGVAEGLRYMHKRGLIHRDFSSRNVMFRNGCPVIIDFGLTISKLDKLKPTADRRGTPGYMAPELVLKNQVDVRSDVYAFGVVMYETATGKHPFPGGGGLDSMQKNIRVDPKSPSEVKADISQPVDRIILKAMHKSPDQRYQDMGKVLEELTRLSEDDFGA